MEKQDLKPLRPKKLEQVRTAFADYWWSEGCTCCQDTDAHKKAEAELAALLQVPKYDDGSGFNWKLFVTIENKGI